MTARVFIGHSKFTSFSSVRIKISRCPLIINSGRGTMNWTIDGYRYKPFVIILQSWSQELWYFTNNKFLIPFNDESHDEKREKRCFQNGCVLMQAPVAYTEPLSFQMKRPNRNFGPIFGGVTFRWPRSNFKKQVIWTT